MSQPNVFEKRTLNSISTWVFNHPITIRKSITFSFLDAFLKGCRKIKIGDKRENYFPRLFLKRHGIIKRSETFDLLSWEETDYMLRFSKHMYHKCFFTAILNSTKQVNTLPAYHVPAPYPTVQKMYCACKQLGNPQQFANAEANGVILSKTHSQLSSLHTHTDTQRTPWSEPFTSGSLELFISLPHNS